MSSSVKIIAALLGCAVVAILWFRGGDEPSRPPEVSEPETRPRSAYEKPPKRQMLLDQPAVPGSLEAGESRRPGAMKDRLDARTQKREERKMARQRKEPRPERENQPEESVEHWRDVVLNNPDPDERADALNQLDYDDPAAMEVLVAALQDRDPEVRLTALDELWVNTDEPPLNLLASLLDDPEAEIRAEAVRMIGDSEDPGAVALLESVLGDSDEDVRSEAADALDLDVEEFEPEDDF